MRGLIDRKGEAGGKADLRDLVDIDAVLRQFGTDRFQEGELRRELFLQSPAHPGLALLHLLAARGRDAG